MTAYYQQTLNVYAGRMGEYLTFHGCWLYQTSTILLASVSLIYKLLREVRKECNSTLCFHSYKYVYCIWKDTLRYLLLTIFFKHLCSFQDKINTDFDSTKISPHPFPNIAAVRRKKRQEKNLPTVPNVNKAIK